MRPDEFDKLAAEAPKLIPSRFRRRMKNFESFAMPDRIVIFQGPHERLARSPAQLAEMVAGTVWHEVAHYFGMNEAQVRAAERRRRAR